MLGPEDQWLPIEDAKKRFLKISTQDPDNEIWGNAWCI